MKKILIAENNEINVTLLVSVLKNMNIEIIHAANGIEAIELCDLNPDISLILMDVNMPLMGGEAAAISIKKSHPDIPIISMTAYIAFGRIRDENKKHFTDSIVKPFTVECIRNTVKKYCFNEN